MTARVLAFVVLAGAALQAQVSFDRILQTDKEPQNWLCYSGTLFNQRHSQLTQITPANVKNLELQWVWQARSLEKFEATSIVVDGVLYTVQAPNDVVALDAVTGRPFWTFTYENLSRRARLLRTRQSRRRHPRRHAVTWARSTRTCWRSTPRPASWLWKTQVARSRSDRYAITLAPTSSRTR